MPLALQHQSEVGCEALSSDVGGRCATGASGTRCQIWDFWKLCWDRRQTVNLVSAGGLVEQSNAAKNNAVDKLAGSAAGRLAGWLAAGAARGWLAN